MSKYLVLRTFCDNQNVRFPNLYVLELKTITLHQFDLCTDIVKRVVSDTGFLPHPGVVSVDFNWRQGYWLNAGEDTGFDLNEYFRVIDADPMNVVGEDMLGARMTVSAEGFIAFQGWVEYPRVTVHTCPAAVNAYIFNIAVLRRMLSNG
jgi:hypothetical protein